MPKRIFVRDLGKTVIFPDDMSMDEIQRELDRLIDSQKASSPTMAGSVGMSADEEPTTEIGKALTYGVNTIVPKIQRSFANQSDALFNMLPLPESWEEGPRRSAARWKESSEDTLRRLSQKFVPDTLAEKVASGIAGAAGDLIPLAPYALAAAPLATAAVPALGVAGAGALAGAVGFGVPRFLEGYGETGDVQEGLKSGGVGAVEGAAFGLIGPATRLIKGPAQAAKRSLAHAAGGGSVMAGSAAASGQSPEDIAAAGITGAALSAPFGKIGKQRTGPRSLADAVQDAELVAARGNIMSHAPGLLENKIPGFGAMKTWLQEKFSNPAIVEENVVGGIVKETGVAPEAYKDPRLLGRAGPTTAAAQVRAGALHGFVDTLQPNIAAPTKSLSEIAAMGRPSVKSEGAGRTKGVPNWYLDMNVFLDTNHVKELRARGVDFKGLTDNPDAVLDSLRRNYPNTIKQWEQVQVHMNEIGNFGVDMLQRAGRFSKEQAANIKKDGSYVNLQRHLEDSPGTKGSGSGAAIHQIKGGSGQKINDVFANTLSLLERAYKEANQSYHHTALIDIIKTSANPEKYISPVKNISFTSVLGKKRGQKTPTKQAVAPVGRPSFSDKESILTIKRDGRAESYALDPALYRSLRIRGRPELPASLQTILSIPQKAKKMATLGYTGLNPGFSFITNPPRDMFSAMLQTGEPGKVGMGHLQRLWKTTVGKKAERGSGPMTETEKNYLRSGAPIAGPVAADIGVALSTRDSIINNSERFGLARDLVKHPIDAFRDLTSWSENINRLPEYLRAEQMYGAGTANANVAGRAWSKDVTLDFSRMGEYSRWANEFIPFFNAAIQGASKFTRTLKERPVTAVMQGVAQVTAPMLALWYIHKDEEWYQELPTWEKTIFAHFKVGDKIIRVPLPFEWGILFGSLPVALFDSAYQKDPKRLKEGVDQALKTLLPDFIPQIAKPLIEAGMNRDTFRDRPLESASMERRLPQDRYRETTPELYKGIGSVTGMSPAKLQHMAESYTGGLIKEPAKLIDVAVGKESVGAGNVPFVHRVFSNQERSGQSVNDFYTENKTMQEAWTSAKKRHESGDVLGARRLLEDYADVLGLSRGEIALLTGKRDWTIPKKMKKFNKAADAMSKVRQRKGENREITALARIALGR